MLRSIYHAGILTGKRRYFEKEVLVFYVLIFLIIIIIFLMGRKPLYFHEGSKLSSICGFRQLPPRDVRDPLLVYYPLLQQFINRL